MSISRKVRGPALGLAWACALLSGCGEEPDENALSDEGPAAPEENGRVFFSPRKGEVWKYKVQKEIPIELQLSDDDADPPPERTESGHLITFERVRTCTGRKHILGAEKMLTTMQISENGELRGEELYGLGGEGVISRGWIPAGTPVSEAKLLTPGVALATPNMRPGQIWERMGREPGRSFLFRVIEQCQVTVPAGTFDTFRIQIISEQDTSALKRTIWFAEKVGIVKEEVIYYGELRVRVRERSELVHWIVPSNGLPVEATVVVRTKEGDGPLEDHKLPKDESRIESGSVPDSDSESAPEPDPENADDEKPTEGDSPEDLEPPSEKED
jgi:hypothetical protein